MTPQVTDTLRMDMISTLESLLGATFATISAVFNIGCNTQ